MSTRAGTAASVEVRTECVPPTDFEVHICGEGGALKRAEEVVAFLGHHEHPDHVSGSGPNVRPCSDP